MSHSRTTGRGRDAARGASAIEDVAARAHALRQCPPQIQARDRALPPSSASAVRPASIQAGESSACSRNIFIGERSEVLVSERLHVAPRPQHAGAIPRRAGARGRRAMLGTSELRARAVLCSRRGAKTSRAVARAWPRRRQNASNAWSKVARSSRRCTSSVGRRGTPLAARRDSTC